MNYAQVLKNQGLQDSSAAAVQGRGDLQECSVEQG